MGYTSWESEEHQKLMAAVVASGGVSQFVATITKTPSAERLARDSMDPKVKLYRECRDSSVHPLTTPCIVGLDQTGSMGDNVDVVLKGLNQMVGIILRNGYVTDPVVLFMAFGDEYSDPRGVLQVGEGESGIEMTKWLLCTDKVGLGGGQARESSGLAMFHTARFVQTDAWEKRHEKGHFFVVTDEMPYQQITRKSVLRWLGKEAVEATAEFQLSGQETEELKGRSLPLRQVAEELKECYYCHLIQPTGSDYTGNMEMLQEWADLFGWDDVFICDANEIPLLIATIIGRSQLLQNVEREDSQGSNLALIKRSLALNWKRAREDSGRKVRRL